MMMFEAGSGWAGEYSMPTEDDIALIFYYSETETMDRSCVGGGHDLPELRSFFVALVDVMCPANLAGLSLFVPVVVMTYF